MWIRIGVGVTYPCQLRVRHRDLPCIEREGRKLADADCASVNDRQRSLTDADNINRNKKTKYKTEIKPKPKYEPKCDAAHRDDLAWLTRMAEGRRREAGTKGLVRIQELVWHLL